MCDREEENNNERARVNNMEDSKKVARARNVAESLLNTHLIQTSGQPACADHRLIVIGLASCRHGCRGHIDQPSFTLHINVNRNRVDERSKTASHSIDRREGYIKKVLEEMKR
jgi:hypothetical protein